LAKPLAPRFYTSARAFYDFQKGGPKNARLTIKFVYFSFEKNSPARALVAPRVIAERT
jgi:hypothetical protein